jgi:MFS family permease
MRAGWALLRRRDFGLLWAGGLISETGDWFLLVGLPVWVFQVTGSSLVTATVFLVGLLPSLVIGPLAGVLVDRWDRRRTLVAVSLAQAVFLLPLLAVDGPDHLWVVYLVIAVEAALGQLNDPARNALVPSLVTGDDLVSANALIALTSNLARLVGSPLGGVLVDLAGLPGLVIGDAVSFLLGAALLALVRSPAAVRPVRPLAEVGSGAVVGPPAEARPFAGTHPPAEVHPPAGAQPSADARPRGNAPSRVEGPRRGSVAHGKVERRWLSTAPGKVGRRWLSTAPGKVGRRWSSTARGKVGRRWLSTARELAQEWVDGLRVTVRDHELRWALVVDGLAAVAQGIFTVLFVVFVTRELGGDGGEVGLLRGVQAIGGLLGGVVVVGLARRLAPGRLLGGSLLVFALVDLAIWNGPLVTTAAWFYLGLFVAAGVPGIGFMTGLTALVQERAPDAYLGRVFATFLGSFNGLMAIGILLAGLLGDAVGVVAVLNGQAGLYLLAGLVALATLGRRERRDGYPRTSKRERIPLA